MTEHVFKTVELVGLSKESVSDATYGAVTRTFLAPTPVNPRRNA